MGGASVELKLVVHWWIVFPFELLFSSLDGGLFLSQRRYLGGEGGGGRIRSRG